MTFGSYPLPRSSRNHYVDPPSFLEQVTSSVSPYLKPVTEAVPRRHGGQAPRRRKERWRGILNLRVLLICLWTYSIWSGERLVFQRSFKDCDWRNWEQWVRFSPAVMGSSWLTLMRAKSREAMPHHMVLIADPQLVDPHT